MKSESAGNIDVTLKISKAKDASNMRSVFIYKPEFVRGEVLIPIYFSHVKEVEG